MISYKRSLIIIVILILTIFFVIFGVDNSKDVPILKPLNTIDKKIGQWEYTGEIELKDQVIQILGSDDYIEYIYQSPDNQAIDLYVGYFSSLREGKQFHSPKNCIVGGGAIVLSTDTINIPVNGDKENFIPVNKMILKRGDQRQIVLYWYQCRGRYIRSEYTEKIYRVLDSIGMRRTDGSFVRIITTEEDDDTLASLVDFTGQLIPVLERYIPGSRLLSEDEKK